MTEMTEMTEMTDLKHTDARTLSFINLYAILGGALPELCRQVPQARELIAGYNIRLGFVVKGGPAAVLIFRDGEVVLEPGEGKCDIRLPFRSPEKFNGMMEGTVTPFPSHGFTKLGFLTGPFVRLTNCLTRYLKPTADDLKQDDFFRAGTIVMFQLIMGAVAQIGNEDRIGRNSASYIVDGNIRMAITEQGQVVTAAHIAAKDHHLRAIATDTENVMSEMEFEGVRNARALFDGEASSFTMICDRKLRMRGMISQLDNINRILDRVALYLA